MMQAVMICEGINFTRTDQQCSKLKPKELFVLRQVVD